MIFKISIATLLLSTLLLTSCQSNITPEPGFKNLLNGKDLSGWCYRAKGTNKLIAKFDGLMHSSDERYSADNGKLVVNPGKGIQKIWTQEEFGTDFILKLEFRAAVNADSGIYVRGPQLQCRDYLVAGPYKDLKNYKPQDWNEIIVIVKGKKAVCTCNGEALEFTRVLPISGPIGLEADRDQMEYRNIRIKTIK
jgi:hypothetical protein